MSAESLVLVALASSLAPPSTMALDLGCGSGYIANALSLLRPDLELYGLDIQPALVAQATAQQRDIRWETGHWSAPQQTPTQFFDTVIFNPPYFSPQNSRVSPHRPRQIARSGSGDTLAKQICAAQMFLKHTGTLIVSIHHSRQAELFELLHISGLPVSRAIELVHAPGKRCFAVIMIATIVPAQLQQEKLYLYSSTGLPNPLLADVNIP